MFVNRMATFSMAPSLYRASLSALSQRSIIAGITPLPVALAAEQVGLRLPIGRVIDRLGDAFDRLGDALDRAGAT
jgi:hypothetical protein